MNTPYPSVLQPKTSASPYTPALHPDSVNTPYPSVLRPETSVSPYPSVLQSESISSTASASLSVLQLDNSVLGPHSSLIT